MFFPLKQCIRATVLPTNNEQMMFYFGRLSKAFVVQIYPDVFFNVSGMVPGNVATYACAFLEKFRKGQLS